MAKQTEQRISLMPTFVKFENEGDSVGGKLIAVDMVDIKGLGVPKYTLDSPDGRKAFLGTAQLADCLNGVPLGTVIHVEYIGKARTGNGYMAKQFNVWQVVDGQPYVDEVAA